MLRRVLILAAVVGMAHLTLNHPLLAHHSGAAYETTPVTLKGTVAEYDWGNPHVVVYWDVKNDDGNAVRWSGELSSVSSMLAEGMTKNSLKPGDDVIMLVKRAKSGTPFSIVVQIKKADGTMVLGHSRRAGGTVPLSGYGNASNSDNQN